MIEFQIRKLTRQVGILGRIDGWELNGVDHEKQLGRAEFFDEYPSEKQMLAFMALCDAAFKGDR